MDYVKSVKLNSIKTAKFGQKAKFSKLVHKISGMPHRGGT